MHLHQRGEPDRLGALDQAGQLILVEGGDDQQREVGTRGARFPQLVGGDDEVLAQHRDVHGTTHVAQVLEAAAEPSLLGQHADRGGTTGGVVGGERGGVGDRRQRALARAGALDLGDHADSRRPEGRHRVACVGGSTRRLLHRVERGARLALSEVEAYAVDDLVENGHGHLSGTGRVALQPLTWAATAPHAGFAARRSAGRSVAVLAPGRRRR